MNPSDSIVSTQRLEQTQSTAEYFDGRAGMLESEQSIMTNGIDTQHLKQILTSHIRGDEAMDITSGTFDDYVLGSHVALSREQIRIFNCFTDMETQVTDLVPELNTNKRPTFGAKDSDEVGCSCGVAVRQILRDCNYYSFYYSGR